MQRILINFTNNCGGNQLNYNNDLPAIGNKNHALQKLFKTNFLTRNRQREHIFLRKIIYNNYFIVTFIETYSLIFISIV